MPRASTAPSARSRRPGERPQEAQLAGAFQLQCQECGEHPREGDHRGEQPQHPGDGEGPVEEPHGLRADGAALSDPNPEAFREARLDGRAQSSVTDPGASIDPDAAVPTALPVAFIGAPAHRHPAAIGAVIVIDPGDAQGPRPAIGAQRDTVPPMQIAMVGQGLGDQHRPLFLEGPP
jgi:hypothetical protein